MKRYKATDGRIKTAQTNGDTKTLKALTETNKKPKTPTQYVSGVTTLEEVQEAQRTAYEERGW